MSPIDGKPMKRADKDAVQDLLEHVRHRRGPESVDSK